MLKTRLFAVLLATSALVLPARALDATPEGAQRLKETFETYLGKPAAGAPAAVEVAPEGEGYRVNFDLAALMRPLDAVGIKLETSLLPFTATPKADGNWHVVAGGSMRAKATLPQQGEETIEVNDFKLDGIFNPALAAFLDASYEMKGMSIQQSVPNATVSTTLGAVQHRQSGAATGAGAFSGKSVGSVKDYAFDLTITPPARESLPAPAPVKIGFHAAELASEGVMDGWRWRQMLELWAFFVAHRDRAAIAAGQADLKALLRAAAPLMDRIDAKVALNKIDVESPVGPMHANAIGVRVESTGLAKDASFGEAFSFSGIALPPGLAPAWATGLVPTDASFGFKIGGLDLAEASAKAIEVFDVNRPEIIPDGDGRALAANLLRSGVKVVIEPGRIVAPLLEIGFDGALSGTGPDTAGVINIKAKGMEAAMEAASKGMANDMMAARAFGALAFAKGLAKPGPDGTQVWVVELAPGRGPTVNGKAIGGGK